jgi:hypothetical protein
MLHGAVWFPVESPPLSMNIQIGAGNQAVDVMAQQYIFKPDTP